MAAEPTGGGPLARFGGALVPGPAWFEQAVAQPFETSSVEVAGAKISYLRWGSRSRPGLLLVHGNGAHAHWWQYIAPFMAREYNVAAMDLSGMGDSGHRYVAGLEASSITIDFFNDALTSKTLQTLNSSSVFANNVVVTVKQTSAATSATNPLYTMTCLINNTTDINGAVGDLSTQSVTWNVSGTVAITTS
jgi:hypothetical protein